MATKGSIYFFRYRFLFEFQRKISQNKKARYKLSLDPTVEDVKKVCTSMRKNAKDERVVFHYNVRTIVFVGCSFWKIVIENEFNISCFSFVRLIWIETTTTL